MAGWGQPVTPSDLFSRLVADLAAGIGYETDRVFLTLWDESECGEAASSHKFVAVRLGRSASDQSLATGGGRTTTVLTSSIRVSLFAPNLRDREFRSGKVISATTLSLWSESSKIIDTLQMWSPTDVATGNYLLVKPGRLLSVDFGSRGGKPMWAAVHSDWEIVFRAILT